MQITTSKKLKNHSDLSIDIADLIFHITLGLPEHNHLNQHDNTVLSMDVQLHVTNKQNSSTLCRNISTLIFWGMLDMPDQNSHYGGCFKKGSALSLIFILTVPFQPYLSLRRWWCVFCLFTLYISVFCGRTQYS